MPSSTGPGGPFPDGVVASVSSEHGVSADELAALIDRHQRSVRELPGVEELVYEWRKHFDGVVLDRTTETYYLSVPARVWDEFGDALDASPDLTDALVAAHREALGRRAGLPETPAADRSFVVLDRREGED